ncbi:hypothetical protein ADEAN_000102600 [Angomonas deanei]|uniref:Uncharacterized protein n=1 Tax=Angomonas deanei TaxID=59799 RepID=A0A7G2C4C5_9TRYP|nr:hypothetical protein ADEAN_000102600 [Angomonas deanei]
MKRIKQAYARAKNTYVTVDGVENRSRGSNRSIGNHSYESDDEHTGLTRKEAKTQTDWQKIKGKVSKNVKQYKVYLDNKRMQYSGQAKTRAPAWKVNEENNAPKMKRLGDRETKPQPPTAEVPTPAPENVVEVSEEEAAEAKLLYYEQLFNYSLREHAVWVDSPKWESLEAETEMEALDLTDDAVQENQNGYEDSHLEQNPYRNSSNHPSGQNGVNQRPVGNPFADNANQITRVRHDGGNNGTGYSTRVTQSERIREEEDDDGEEDSGSSGSGSGDSAESSENGEEEGSPTNSGHPANDRELFSVYDHPDGQYTAPGGKQSPQRASVSVNQNNLYSHVAHSSPTHGNAQVVSPQSARVEDVYEDYFEDM